MGFLGLSLDHRGNHRSGFKPDRVAVINERRLQMSSLLNILKNFLVAFSGLFENSRFVLMPPIPVVKAKRHHQSDKGHNACHHLTPHPCSG
jgi:hypothetical protein